MFTGGFRFVTLKGEPDIPLTQPQSHVSLKEVDNPDSANNLPLYIFVGEVFFLSIPPCGPGMVRCWDYQLQQLEFKSPQVHGTEC